MARAGGASLPTLVERLVTGPLRMKHTGFTVSDPARLVTAYVDGAPPRRMADPDVVPFGGGAGMAGAAPDFLTFLETLRQGGGAILTSDSVRAMMANQIGALRVNVELTPSWGFGFGGAVLMDPQLAGVPQAAGTWKWGGVYGHHWYVDPRNRLSVVTLTNTALEGMAGGFVVQLMNAVYAAQA